MRRYKKDYLKSVSLNTGQIAKNVDIISDQYKWKWLKAGSAILKIIMASVAVIIPLVIALEAILQSKNEEERRQLDQTITILEHYLKSTENVQQANAIYELAQIARSEVLISEKPSQYHFGAILLNRYINRNIETPYENRCRAIFREFVQQRRVVDNLAERDGNSVSKALLREGVLWEKRLWSFSKADSSLLFRAQLPHAYASNLDCSNINFSYSNLSHSKITASKFKDSILSNCNLEQVVFIGSSFQFSSLAESKAPQANFSFTKCNNTSFQNADLKGANFNAAKLHNVDFSESKLDGSTFKGSDLHNVNFEYTSLKYTVFSQVNISSSKFKGSDVEGADFRNVESFTEDILLDALNKDKAFFPDTTKSNK